MPLNLLTDILIDPEDFEMLSKYTWFIDHKGYAQATIDLSGVSLRMHRLIMQAKKGQIVDHINGNRLDNRRTNLRFVSWTQSNVNRKLQTHNTSGFKGVNKANGRYQARITVDGDRIYLGSFATAEEAGIAYAKAAKKYHGAFVTKEVLNLA